MHASQHPFGRKRPHLGKFNVRKALALPVLGVGGNADVANLSALARKKNRLPQLWVGRET